VKIVIFLIAALYACLSGWLYAHLQRFVNPTPFGLHIGIEYLFMAVVGGAAHVWGALVGAGVITILKQWLQDWLPKIFGQSGNFEVIFFGILLILVLQRARDGLWPGWPGWRRPNRVSARWPRPPPCRDARCRPPARCCWK
jgi:ABC-type branched-subunit amino acid transport system permease subunit